MENVELSNLEFIAHYLWTHPGTKNTALIRRALCKKTKRNFHRGYYCEYFHEGSYYPANRPYADPAREGCLWFCNAVGVWVLTEKGTKLAIEADAKLRSIRNRFMNASYCFRNWREYGHAPTPERAVESANYIRDNQEMLVALGIVKDVNYG